MRANGGLLSEVGRKEQGILSLTQTHTHTHRLLVTLSVFGALSFKLLKCWLPTPYSFSFPRETLDLMAFWPG